MVLRFIRIWLPAIVVLGGIAVIVIRRDDNGLDGGAAIIGAGLSIWLMNVLWRVGVRGDVERDEENEARAFFDRWGHWPDEPGPGNADRRGQDDAPPHHRAPAAHGARRGPAPPRRPGG